MNGVRGLPGGATLEPLDERGLRYLLEGREVHAGDVLEVLTDAGWVSGHYTVAVHPDSGKLAFEMHVVQGDDLHEHVVIFLSPTAFFRWPTR